MNFIRDNILKIFLFIFILVIGMIIFSLIFNNKGIGSGGKSYAQMEQAMIDATRKYTNKNTKLLPKKENEMFKVNLDTLQNSKYLKEFTALEDENVKCMGYTEILYKNKKNIFVPYLKCGKYYETKTIAQHIKDNEEIVTSNDGLYQIGNSYVFRGESPNNYLVLGNRLYRIMEINGEELKLISTKKLNEYIVWDDRYNVEKGNTVGINDYSKSRLKEYFNGMIKSAVINTNSPVNKKNEEDTFISSFELQKMVPHDICVGKRSVNNSGIDTLDECQVTEKDQLISLITVSEYARASIDPNCKSIYDNACVNYNYFSTLTQSYRTMTAVAENSYSVYTISNGVVSVVKASSLFNPNIVIYIDSTSLYKSGDGTYEDPYLIR